jgi:ABC-2 type transport system permease protein
LNWDQLKTILWLRWRLARNQWARSKGIGGVIAGFIVAGAFLTGGTSFAVGLVVGITGVSQAKASAVWGIWFGLTAAFLFMWLVGLMTELERSESIDLQRLIHLPVRLGQIFTINYLASHLALSIILIVPAMMGLALGLAISRGPAMLLLAPLALSMVLMITAWTYCLRGWLAALMTNPRKRRNVVMVCMLAFVLLAQGPNLYFNVYRRLNNPGPSASSQQFVEQRAARIASQKASLEKIKAFQKFIPPFWLPLGAEALAEEDGSAVPACAGLLGCAAIGALGLRSAYQGTLRFYRGDPGGKARAQTKPVAAPSAAPPPAQSGRRFLELRPPLVPEQAAATALATFRSLMRAPEVKMALGTSMLVPLIMGGSLLFRSSLKLPDAARPFIATGAVAFPVFMLVQFFSNQFGLDRDGFRALLLCPADRRFILMGKNLACLPVGAGFGLILLLLIVVRLHLSPIEVAASLFQLAALLMLGGMIGNLLSVLVPYRIQPGTMKPTKMPGLAMVVLMLCQLLFPLALAPAFVPALAQVLWQNAGWPRAGLVNLVLSASLASAMALAYWQALAPMGRLLQSREIKILGILAVEVE